MRRRNDSAGWPGAAGDRGTRDAGRKSTAGAPRHGDDGARKRRPPRPRLSTVVRSRVLDSCLLSLCLLAASALAGCGGGEAAANAKVALIVGAPGTGPGYFFYPRALAVNPRGELCVADRSGRIQCFDREG